VQLLLDEPLLLGLDPVEVLEDLLCLPIVTNIEDEVYLLGLFIGVAILAALFVNEGAHKFFLNGLKAFVEDK